MRKFKVLFTDPPWALDATGTVDVSRAELEQGILGRDVELCFAQARARTYEHDSARFLSLLAAADALVICRFQIAQRAIEAARNLKVVARQGVGFDNLNPDLLQQHGIVGFNIPDYCISEVVAHTIALLLACERQLVPQHNALAGGAFNVHAGGVPRRLSERRAGIIGFGRIGRAVSHHLRAFYGEVAAYDPYVSRDMMAAYGVRKVELAPLLRDSDVLTLHCALNQETRHLIGESAISQMKHGALVINAARGALIEAQALHDALCDGRLRGAGLDVFFPENPWQDPWWSRVVGLPNVVATSHRAFLSEEAEESQRRRAVEGVRGVLKEGIAPREGLLTPLVVPRTTVGCQADEEASCRP
jgi:D-3-phosphoglycerate dehydrogenase